MELRNVSLEDFEQGLRDFLRHKLFDRAEMQRGIHRKHDGNVIELEYWGPDEMLTTRVQLLKGNKLDVTLPMATTSADMAHVDALRRFMRNRWERRPITEKTMQRGEEFKRHKDAHPDWTQNEVAFASREALGELVTEETVSNTYDLLNWKWKRGKRRKT